METRRRRTSLRILAPLALIAFGVALVMIVSSAGKTSSAGGGRSARAAEKARDLGTGTTKPAARRKHTSSGKLPQRYYIVKPGDTLGKIAQDTGIPVTTLQSLNPGLDQFSLIAGQKIKLR
jgi:LysM repeat protein